MPTYTNKSGGPRILNTTKGPVTLQDGESRDDIELSKAEAESIKRVGFLDAPGTPRPEAAPASTGGADDFDVEAFIRRRLEDISDAEIAALTPEQRDAVMAAEQDREVPRKGLTERLRG